MAGAEEVLLDEGVVEVESDVVISRRDVAVVPAANSDKYSYVSERPLRVAKGDAHVERIAHAVHAVGIEGLLLAGTDRVAVRRVGDRHVPHLCEVRLDLQT